MDNIKKTAEMLRTELSRRDAESVQAASKEKLLSARQTIEAVLDAGTFVEIGAYVKRSISSDDFEGVICGYGAVCDRLVFIFAQDFGRMKGAFDNEQAKKICNIYSLAIKNGAPVIGIFNSAGAVVSEGIDALTAYGKVMRAVSDASGIIPQVAYINGVCAGSAAVIASMFDISVMLKEKTGIYVTPPTLLSGKDTDSAANSSKNGLISRVCDDERSASNDIRSIIGFLPQNNQEGTAIEANSDDLNRLVDLSFANGYEIENVLSAISDNGKFIELSGEYAKECVCALSFIGGTAAGIVTNRATVNGGCLTPDSARKISKFIMMCDSFGIPVVTLADSEGVLVGDTYENAPFASELAKLAFAYSSSECAKITVVLGKAYGSAFTLMGSKSVGADVAFALDSAEICIMSPKSAVAFLKNSEIGKKSREEIEADWAAENAAPVNAAVCGAVDDIIAASELRMRICAALSMLASKCCGVPSRRHTNLPL